MSTAVISSGPPGYSNERLLWICVGVSMLIHALIVWQGHAIPPAPQLSPPIRATIRPYVPPAPPPTVAAPEPPKPEPKKAEPPPAPKPLPKPVVPEAPRLKPVDQPKPVAAPTAPPVAAPQPAPATPPAAAAASDARPDAAKAPASASNAPASAADPDERALVRGFQLQLANAAEKYKRYPSEAMQQSWEGKALVRLRIGIDGKTAGIEIVNSSGHEVLDDQAKIAINKAKPLVQVPPGLRGKEFNADIVMVFTLAK